MQPLYPALVLALLAAVALPSARAEEGAGAGAPGRPPSVGRVVQGHKQGEHVELERLRQQKRPPENRKPVSNAFNPKRWYVPPPPPKPPPPPPPPPPTAPPVPFTYLGRYEDAHKRVVMLGRGTKLYTVSQGDVIDGTYRVDRISDSAVDLIYLPLNISQSVSTTPPPQSAPRGPAAGQFVRRP